MALKLENSEAQKNEGDDIASIRQVAQQVVEKYRPDLLGNTAAKEICEKTLRNFLNGIGTRSMTELDFLRGLTVLDLGCGSYDHESIKPDSDFLEWEPWLCRALHTLRVNVIGVDYFLPRMEGEQPSVEDWPFYQLDLTDPYALAGFQENTFDIINCHELIGVHLEDELFWDRQCFSPTLEGLAQQKSRNLKEIQENIFAQALRLLKERGLFVVNSSLLYRKTTCDTGYRFELLRPRGYKTLAKPQTA